MSSLLFTLHFFFSLTLNVIIVVPKVFELIAGEKCTLAFATETERRRSCDDDDVDYCSQFTLAITTTATGALQDYYHLFTIKTDMDRQCM